MSTLLVEFKVPEIEYTHDKQVIKRKERNRHHLVPRSRGGIRRKNNLLYIHVSRHDAWHRLFHTETIKETLKFLDKLIRADERNERMSNSLWRKYTILSQKYDDWREVFGEKSVEEAYVILYRMYRAKRRQRRQ